ERLADDFIFFLAKDDVLGRAAILMVDQNRAIDGTELSVRGIQRVALTALQLRSRALSIFLIFFNGLGCKGRAVDTAILGRTFVLGTTCGAMRALRVYVGCQANAPFPPAFVSCPDGVLLIWRWSGANRGCPCRL